MRRSSLLLVLVLAMLGIVDSGAGGATAPTPKLGGTIVLWGTLEPACLNRLVARCDPGLLFASEKVLLPAFDVDARFRFRPRLVSGVTVSHRPPYTLTYHIRPEARWSDGVPVTAADFVFTHATRLARRSELGAEERDALLHVRRVTAVDAETVRVTLRSPFSGWQALFPNVLPQHALQGEDLSKIWVDHIDDPRTGTPIGSGPFLVEGLERGKALTLIRNPRYWGPHPARVDRLVIRYDIADPVASLMSGDLDVAEALGPPEASILRKVSDLRVVAPPSAASSLFAIRQGPGGNPALRNPLVRQALAYGIDREAIGRAIGGGPRRPLQSVVYLVQSPYHRPNWERYRSRPALARTLLARAGCKHGADGIYACGGRRLSLRFVTTAGNRPRQVTLTTVAAQLRKVGIEVAPKYVALRAFYQEVLPRGRFDVALFDWVFSPDPARVTSLFACRGVENYTEYCSRPVSRMLGQASRTLDPAVQARILNAVDRGIASDVPVLPLFQIRAATAVRRSVKEFAQLPYNSLADAENWWLDR